jgi:hypothetical protein
VKKTLIAIVILLVAALLVKRKNMTWRQSILKTLYPIIMLKGKLMGNKSDILLNTGKAVPQQSFYDLTAVQSNGDTILFSSFKGISHEGWDPKTGSITLFEIFSFIIRSLTISDCPMRAGT